MQEDEIIHNVSEYCAESWDSYDWNQSINVSKMHCRKVNCNIYIFNYHYDLGNQRFCQ